jgi:hypothetical protein
MFSKLWGTNEQVKKAADTEELQADYVIQSDKPLPVRATTSEMTQEELRTRRINLIEAAKFGRPFHENFMLVLLRVWLVIAPIRTNLRKAEHDKVGSRLRR